MNPKERSQTTTWPYAALSCAPMGAYIMALFFTMCAWLGSEKKTPPTRAKQIGSVKKRGESKKPNEDKGHVPPDFRWTSQGRHRDVTRKSAL